jgi:hypothetical protein
MYHIKPKYADAIHPMDETTVTNKEEPGQSPATSQQEGHHPSAEIVGISDEVVCSWRYYSPWYYPDDRSSCDEASDTESMTTVYAKKTDTLDAPSCVFSDRGVQQPSPVFSEKEIQSQSNALNVWNSGCWFCMCCCRSFERPTV